MKFTLSWLKDHLDTDAPVDALVEAMTMAGLEVERVEDRGQTLSAFSVAKVVEAVQHPNADRLRVCQVDTKDGRKEIVCGAPNARAGLTTIYAPLGAFIPGSGITLEAKPVRGVVSNGMLCSGAELQVDEESDGILELDPALEVGVPAAQALGVADAVIDFEVTPNRPDWLGVNGVARDLAAAGLGVFRDLRPAAIAGRFACPVPVTNSAGPACPLFTARLIRGVRNGESPAWLRQRLKAIGLKPRSALVDITNYLSYDRARPLHVYDADTLTGAVEARAGRRGESLKALDGKTYEVTPDMCVIADERGVLGLGGVIGGEASGCSEATANVLVESAYFDPLTIFQTGRALGVASDARYRFERGVDPGFTLAGLELATRMILDLCGGEPSEVVSAGAAPAPPAPIVFEYERVRTLAGLDVPLARTRAILKSLGFSVAPVGQSAKRIVVTPPSWRGDVSTGADLVEEVARIEGYDKLPAPAPAAAVRPAPASLGESRTRLARRALAGAGYLEAVTWSFCARAHAALFGGGADALVLSNPIAADLDCMRPSALPNLLRAAQRNLDRGHGDAKLFEAGPAYAGDGEGEQRRTIAAIWQARPPRHWRDPGPPDVFAMKQDVLHALDAMAAPMQALQHGPPPGSHWHPGRAGALRLGPKLVAAFGEVHPTVLRALDVEGPALAFEIWIDALPSLRAKPTRAKPPLDPSHLMPLTRDFAFVVDETTPAADLVRAAYGADRALIADIALFDIYRGPGVAADKKSLAIEVTLQPREKTLTDPEIEAVSARVVSAVMKATGGVLRA